MKLIYDKKAVSWNEALPMGNGRLGCMVYGGEYISQFQLNEDTLWSGMPNDMLSNPMDELQRPMEFIKDGMYKYTGTDSRIGNVYKENIQKIREAIKNKDYTKANEIGEKYLQGGFSQSYMTFGSIFIKFQNIEEKNVYNYKRELDLETAIYNDCFNYGKNNIIKRECFVSFPDNCIVINIESNRKTDIEIYFRGELIQNTFYDEERKNLCAYGKMPSYATPYRPHESLRFEENKGIGFFGTVKVLDDDASTITGDYSSMQISECGKLTLIVNIVSGFNKFNVNPQSNSFSLYGILENKLLKASNYSYDSLKKRHIEDYQKLYSRLYINLSSKNTISENEENNIDKLYSLDKKIDDFQNTLDPNFIALMFQYSRYLLISSSRAGSQPTNLQGIWNESVLAPWSSNYTININFPMNYWLTNVCNLDECIEPLVNMVEELSISGAKVAKDFYNCRGWTCHHNSDLWRHAIPTGNGPQHTLWYLGSAWLCLNIWYHYEYTEDTNFLKRTFPILRNAALFYLDYLVFEEGYYHTIPSTSPENTFIDPKTKKRCSIALSSAMDISLIKELFEACIKASQICENYDNNLNEEIKEKLSKLAPVKINVEGSIAEWYDTELLTFEKDHRHISHLYEIYPGYSFIINDTFKKASINSLDERGNKGTGWSIIWKIACRARLKQNEKINILLKNLIRRAPVSKKIFNHTKDAQGIDFINGAGIYPNLLLAHPPYQIDGSLGFGAAIAETIIQSYDCIEFLPAIPRQWKSGKVLGIKVKGNIVADIQWEYGKLTKAILTSKKDKYIKIKYKDKTNETYIKSNIKTDITRLLL